MPHLPATRQTERVLFLSSTIARARRSSAPLLIAATLTLVVLAGCSSGDAENTSIEPATTRTELVTARQAADPVQGELDPNRTTTSVSRTTVPPNSQTLHVLGSIRSITNPSPNWQSNVALVGNDLATVASLGCDPTSPECTAPLVSAWSNGGIELLNIATASSVLAGDALAAYVEQLRVGGLTVIGYGPNRASAVSGVTVGDTGSAISLHAISLSASDDASAGFDSPGIAGPSTFDALLEAIDDRQSAGVGVVVVVDVGSLDDRSPTPEQIGSIQRLIDLGVDAVIGHGSDFIQRFDRVGQSTVAYNLGNVVIDTPDVLRTDSAVLRLEFGTPGRACLLPSTATAAGPLLDDVDVQSCG